MTPRNPDLKAFNISGCVVTSFKLSWILNGSWAFATSIASLILLCYAQIENNIVLSSKSMAAVNKRDSGKFLQVTVCSYSKKKNIGTCFIENYFSLKLF